MRAKDSNAVSLQEDAEISFITSKLKEEQVEAVFIENFH